MSQAPPDCAGSACSFDNRVKQRCLAGDLVLDRLLDLLEMLDVLGDLHVFDMLHMREVLAVMAMHRDMLFGLGDLHLGGLELEVSLSGRRLGSGGGHSVRSLGQRRASDQAYGDGGSCEFPKHGIVLFSIGLPQTLGVIRPTGVTAVVTGENAPGALNPL